MREGKRIRTRHLEVLAATSPLASQAKAVTSSGVRLGFIVPKYGQTAVLRNRLKRRLRELGRSRLRTLDVSADVVIRVRPDAYRATFALLANDMEQARARIERLAREQGDAAHSATDTTPAAP